MSEKIIIFDTTLRDGEQSPGASMNTEEKIQIALALERLGVDVMEAGFAASSNGDFEAINKIAQIVKNSSVCSLARCVENDIIQAAKALEPAEKKRIHTFIATSPIHMEFKLKKSPDEVLKTAVKNVKLAKSLCDDVEFSCEDALRSDISFLKEMADAVYEAGASTLNLPDTVGYRTPQEMYEFFKIMSEYTKGKLILSAHNHNDLGLATANTLAAILGGARQIEVTLNGLGERAGNSALEEAVMAIKTRKDAFSNFYTQINTKEIYPSSKLLSNIIGVWPQPNKAIVGKNAFTHESGIHQDGVLKHPETYEIMKASDIGLVQDNLILGKHSGRAAFKDKLKILGFNLNDEELNRAFNDFKELCDKKKEVFDDDLIAIISAESVKIEEKFKLINLQVSDCTQALASAAISLECDNEIIKEAAIGDGVIDAIFKVIDRASKVNGFLQDYKVNAVSKGKDALAQVSVKVSFEGQKAIIGNGLDLDTMQASAKAYLAALNSYISMNK
ncbi:2-isopropylmalate synthase [Campylobacter canadensis]|uniref:2-isopropylmalate synthase n=1 Tax=Campylobacter canadensis TaxID=449520 RepID=UPI0015572161|nr:2-isopropylmalate synthase [Campylobacter canadensis]MBZ7995437.1 2-isopropylmalate synthase [Campylobacter canadensis]MBZ7996997.1 2-isopropylmalate synthase [Campylobacter canadensis]MBZ8000739.1 2-isopropylmalate synthase [Campylobacter canadensis]MBZ8002602.1 2-isopropylmalate synthase [Campylobacter canadensis]MBZ8004642.1 2-isopropylmalate synthase [Campylobacter canadensis]